MEPVHLFAEENVVEVGIGHLMVAEHPALLVAPALGSCVGVAIWDRENNRGGLGHVMLPHSRGTASTSDGLRFADIAVPELVRRLLEQGADRRDLYAKIAGGAAMFGSDSGASVGHRNVAEVKGQLALLRIPLRGEDTGGAHARTVEMHLDSGALVVRSFKFGTSEL